jgi:hypothetical protein
MRSRLPGREVDVFALESYQRKRRDLVADPYRAVAKRAAQLRADVQIVGTNVVVVCFCLEFIKRWTCTHRALLESDL